MVLYNKTQRLYQTATQSIKINITSVLLRLSRGTLNWAWQGNAREGRMNVGRWHEQTNVVQTRSSLGHVCKSSKG